MTTPPGLVIPGLAGDVVGPASSTDNAVPRWNGTTGRFLQNSTFTIEDNGQVTFGPLLANNYQGPAHIVTGGIRFGGTGSGDQSRLGGIMGNANAGVDVGLLGRTNTAQGGAALRFDNLTSNEVDAFLVCVNQAGDAVGAVSDAVLGCKPSGAVEIGAGGVENRINGRSVVVTRSSAFGAAFGGPFMIGYSGGGYPGIGYNLRATGTANTYSRTGGDSWTWVSLGQGAGTAGNTLLAVYGAAAAGGSFPANIVTDAANLYFAISPFRIDYGLQATETMDHVFFGRPAWQWSSAAEGYLYRRTITSTEVILGLYSNVGGIALRKWRVEADGDTISTTGSYTSDERAKKRIRPIGYGLAEILQLRPIRYQWRWEKDDETESFSISSAQHIEKIMPEMVRQDGNESEDATDKKKKVTLKSVYEKEIVAVMVKAMQEMHDLIQTQSKEIERLSKAIEKLEGKK